MAVRGPAPCPQWIGRPGLAGPHVRSSLIDGPGQQGAARTKCRRARGSGGLYTGPRATQAWSGGAGGRLPRRTCRSWAATGR